MAGLQSRASLRSAADDFDELYQGFDEASLLDTQKQVAEDAVLQRVTQSSRSGQANNGQGSRTRPESRIGVQTAKAIGRRSNGQQLFSANKTDSFRPASSTRGAGYTAKSEIWLLDMRVSIQERSRFLLHYSISHETFRY
ncbi:hypothetical protein RvY_08732-1 [Ramazzottius varieornatus]|uniref:Uncharacterized protein n=1 Tax=Ramazzottius varieornatus TaxID=947166 RepID=A0A1D1V955_RAMVA|nr:hypothetical protein RvY_08732-1 [Ramazzottius varieornatus]